MTLPPPHFIPTAARFPRRGAIALLLIGAAAGAQGCDGPARDMDAIRAYYNYDFTLAREAYRRPAEEARDEQYILNNLRLGLAAFADGDNAETERVFTRTFNLLSTAGLNKDRTAAAVIFYEGVRIWKGEPFEQALAYAWMSAFYATRGDWENMRAAAANSLFRLTDFGKDQTAERVAERAAADDGYLESGYTATDSNFALGFMLQAIASDLSGAPGRDELLNAAVDINSGWDVVADVIRERRYDTLLIVDFGKGPTKVAYGPDESLSRFEPQERFRGPLVVTVDGAEIARAGAMCDVDQMAADLRWKNLEEIREAKSAFGRLAMMGGAVALGVGAHNDSEAAMIGGAAAILAGLLSSAGSRADTRYLEFAPQSIYLVPVLVGRECELAVRVETGTAGAPRMTLPRFRPGEPGRPRAVYLRLHGSDSAQPTWLTATSLVYGNDHDGTFPGDYPWIFGGQDVSIPTPDLLRFYQEGGHCEGMSLDDLRHAYAKEEIYLGSGLEQRPDRPKNPSFRHILEGGTALFTPQPYSMGYKQLMYTTFTPYTVPEPDESDSAPEGENP